VLEDNRRCRIRKEALSCPLAQCGSQPAEPLRRRCSGAPDEGELWQLAGFRQGEETPLMVGLPVTVAARLACCRSRAAVGAALSGGLRHRAGQGRGQRKEGPGSAWRKRGPQARCSNCCPAILARANTAMLHGGWRWRRCSAGGMRPLPRPQSPPARKQPDRKERFNFGTVFAAMIGAGAVLS
jgi:hypothetical protein